MTKINQENDMKNPHVVVLLDESGSMSHHTDQVISTFNEYVKSVEDSAKTVSLYTFDSSGIREKFNKVEPSAVRELTREDYNPNALTPLFDSMANVMKRFEGSKRNVQFVTHTDGAENCSTEWDFPKLDKYIEEMTQKGWLFVYLGEGISGAGQMAQFQGLKVNFTPATRRAAMSAFSDTTLAYASAGSASASSYTADGSDVIDVDKGDKVKKRKLPG